MFFGGGGLLGEQGLPTGIGGLSSGNLLNPKLTCLFFLNESPAIFVVVFLFFLFFIFVFDTDAAVFDMEYARWLEEHHRIMCELRAAVQEHLPENELRLFVDNCLAHYDELMNVKSMIVKSDVFHIVSGMWKTPAERCFMWMGGFRPSDLIKVQNPSP